LLARIKSLLRMRPVKEKSEKKDETFVLESILSGLKEQIRDSPYPAATRLVYTE